MEPEPQDSLVTSTGDFLLIEDTSLSDFDSPVYMDNERTGQRKKVKEIKKTKSWQHDFHILCCEFHSKPSSEALLNLIKFYARHITKDVKSSYFKPNRAAKLKSNLNVMLDLFRTWWETTMTLFDAEEYLETMSNLLTLYVDMEVKASRRGKEAIPKIKSKLLSALFIYLKNSADHIIDVILNSRFTIRTYREIWIPIFKKVISLEVKDGLGYVRFLLLFKLWKRLVRKGEERNSINRLAVDKLSPPPAQLLEFISCNLLSEVLPPPEPSRKPELITRFYMTSKFKLQDAIVAFMKISKTLKNRELTIDFDPSQDFSTVGDSKADSVLQEIWVDVTSSYNLPTLSSLIDSVVDSDLEKYKSPVRKPFVTAKIIKKSNSQTTIDVRINEEKGIRESKEQTKENHNEKFIRSHLSCFKSPEKSNNQNKISPLVGKHLSVLNNSSVSPEDQDSRTINTFENILNNKVWGLAKTMDNSSKHNEVLRSFNDEGLTAREIQFPEPKGVRINPDLIKSTFKDSLSGSTNLVSTINLPLEASEKPTDSSCANSLISYKEQVPESVNTKTIISPSLISVKEKSNMENLGVQRSNQGQQLNKAIDDFQVPQNQNETYEEDKSSHYSDCQQSQVVVENQTTISSIVPPQPLTGSDLNEDTSSTLQGENKTLLSVLKESFETKLQEEPINETLFNKNFCIIEESVPKNEPLRTDCMFQGLHFKSLKSNHSIDALLYQTQTAMLNGQEAMDGFESISTKNHQISGEIYSTNKDVSDLDSFQPSSTAVLTSVSKEEPQTFSNQGFSQCSLQNSFAQLVQNCVTSPTQSTTPSLDSGLRESQHQHYKGEDFLTTREEFNTLTTYTPDKESVIENVESVCSKEQAWCTQMETPGDVVNLSHKMEALQSLGVLSEKVDVNQIELQVEAQNVNFIGDDDCESEDSNLVIDEDIDSTKESNETLEETSFHLKTSTGFNETQVQFVELYNNNDKELVSHEFPNENMTRTNVNPDNLDANEINDCNPKTVPRSTIFISSSARENISLNENSDHFQPSDRRIFYSRPSYEGQNNTKEFLRNDKYFLPQNPQDSVIIQENTPKFLQMKQIKSISILPKNTIILSPSQFQNLRVGRTENSLSDSCYTVQDSLHSVEKSSLPPPEAFSRYKISENDELDNYYCSARNKILFSNRNTEFNEFNQPNTSLKDHNNHIQPCEKPGMIGSDFPVEYAPSQEHISHYMKSSQTDFSNCSQLNQFSQKQSFLDVNEQMRLKENANSSNDSTVDPLCLVINSKENSREIVNDFEFTIFPVAQEVEVCSVSDSGFGDCLGPGEIGHPDWPIADEQSITDSSIYSSTPDPNLYSPKKITSPSCSASNDNADLNSSLNFLELQQVSVDVKYCNTIGSSFKIENFGLHRRTLEMDYDLCCSQRKFKEFSLSQEVPSAIPVPFPPQGRSDNSMVPARCICEQCSDNHQVLLNNYKILTNLRSSKVKPSNFCLNDVVTSEKEQTCETNCNLPLKKRKTLTSSKISEELTFYPNTPMISIAELELTSNKQQNQILLPTLQSQKKNTTVSQKVVTCPNNSGHSLTKSSQQVSCPVGSVHSSKKSSQQVQDNELGCTRRRSTRKRKSTR